jgi:hypothetical protein
MNMAEPDLAAMLKMAKEKRMFFAFVVKGSDGKLIVSKSKIHPKQIEEAKKEVGGGTVLKGRCIGPLTGMVFQVVKEVSPALVATLKKVIKRDAGLTVHLEFQLAPDAEAEHEEGESEEGQGLTGAPTGGTGELSPVGLRAWTAARGDAVTKLKALAGEIAASKDHDAGPAIILVNAIIKNLTAAPTTLQQVVALEDYLTKDEVVADACIAHNIRDPLLSALAACKAPQTARA